MNAVRIPAAFIDSRAHERLRLYAAPCRLDLPRGRRATQLFSCVLRKNLVKTVAHECDHGDLVDDAMGLPRYEVSWEGARSEQLPDVAVKRITRTVYGSLNPAAAGFPMGTTSLFRDEGLTQPSGRICHQCCDHEVVPGLAAGELFIVSVDGSRGFQRQGEP